MKKTLDQHIEDNRNELYGDTTNSQRRRFLEGELESLLKYKENNPNKIEDPTPLELFCSEDPSAPECRIYEV